ncbi:MAG: galactose mutarotase [Bacteroidales bacterium]|nr:galactose mutarotase [Bacteroidales bacterium]
MKRFIFSAALVLLMAACTPKTAQVQLIDAAAFDATIEGKPVSLYTLRGGDLTMQVTNYGTRVVSLWCPDKDGNQADIVLGFNNLDEYVNFVSERYLGATVGPVANRIAGSRFTMDDKEYVLSDEIFLCHGGQAGLDLQVWDVLEHNDSTIVMQYCAADGEGGFPGNRSIVLTYALGSDNTFSVDIQGTTDAPTHLNIAHHPFFNLGGEGSGTILDHILYINASAFTPVDSLITTTGEIRDVTGTPFDFRTPKAIGTDIACDDIQLQYSLGYDHNWVLDRNGATGLVPAATLYDPASGRILEIFTDQPGFQFYSGNFFDGRLEGKWGRKLNYREAVVFEAQKFPNSCNIPSFPSTRIDPGQTYSSTTVFRLGVCTD